MQEARTTVPLHKARVDKPKGGPMDWSSFADWALKALMAGVLAYGVKVLTQMRKSLDRLNEKVATIIEKTAWHQKELDRHDQRLSLIEERLPRKRST